MALLFGLGVMGVVLSNLLAGDGGSSESAVATLPLPARESEGTAEDERPPAAPPSEDPVEEARYDRPSLWGHPAPLARFIALITAAGALLTSVVWGAGWLVVRAVTRSIAGG